MLGLVVNTYVNSHDMGDFEVHRSKASTMDLADMGVPRMEINVAVDEGMPDMETDDDEEPIPSGNVDAIIQSLDVTPIQVVAPVQARVEPQGTPGGYTGSCAGTTQDVLPALTSGAVAFGTPGGCSTSVSPKGVVIPKMETLDILDQRSRPSLDLFRNTRRKMKKTPYVELPEGAIIEVSDEDEGDMDIMAELGVDFDRKKVKGEAMSVAEHNAEFERKVKEDMAAAQAENARKMAVIQEELRAANAKQDQMFMMMQAFFQASGAFPPAHTPPGPFPSHLQAPHPTPVASPPPELQPATSHDAIAAAIREDEDLRTRVRESSGPAVLTPPPSRVGLHRETGIEGVRQGDDTARHTDMVIVEDTQGSPNETFGVHVMDIESSPDRAPHTGALMEEVRMDTLDLGGDDDDVQLVQQTQSSPPGRAAEAMETESPEREDITNARSLIEQEGPAAPSSAAAPPLDDEVTHL